MLQPFMFSLFRDLGSSVRLDAVPPADVYRRGDEIVVHLDLPGVERSSVKVAVENGVLDISAERVYAPEPTDQVLLAERPFGLFRRQFRLRDAVAAENVSAVFADGVLTLRIPVSTPSSRRVEVAVLDAVPAAE
jgi:HSP20 family protein